MKKVETKPSNRRRKMPDRCIYVVRTHDTVLKCGITLDLKRRLRQYKYEFGTTPRVLFSESVPYRCARCIEFGLVWNLEFMRYESPQYLIAAIKDAVRIASENPCGKQRKRHFGLKAYDFYDACGIRFTSCIHSEDGAPRAKGGRK